MAAFGPAQNSWLAKPYRALSLGLFLVVVFYFALARGWSSTTTGDRSASQVAGLTPAVPAGKDTASPNWTWNPSRDRNNHALTAAHCDTTFPDLYFEIDRAATFWKERNEGRKLTKEQYGLDWSEDGGLSVLIHDQQVLYVMPLKAIQQPD